MTRTRTTTVALVAVVLLGGACAATSDDGGTPIANTITLPAPATGAPPADGSLDGEWRAIAATVDGVELTDLDTVGVTFEIAGDRITGSRGCNDFEVVVDLGATSMTFGEGTASEAFCTGPLGEIEAAFRELTSGTVEWSLASSTLSLTAPTSVWVFERAGPATVRPTPSSTALTVVPTPPPPTDPAA